MRSQSNLIYIINCGVESQASGISVPSSETARVCCRVLEIVKVWGALEFDGFGFCIV